LCVDCEGVGAVKRETSVNPSQSRVLSKYMLVLRVHGAILLWHNIDEHGKQNILKLEFALFCLKNNVLTNS
jgi:hypothetical protein